MLELASDPAAHCGEVAGHRQLGAAGPDLAVTLLCTKRQLQPCRASSPSAPHTDIGGGANIEPC